MSSVANPYRAPAAQVADGADEFGPIKVFSFAGRLGRVRYIAYSVGLSFVISLVLGLIAGLAGSAAPGVAVPMIIVAYVLMFLVHAMLSAQRAHDFDASGWLAILAFVPLVNFIFWFIPGTDGENRYGLKTPPNGVLTIIIAAILPFFFVVGMLAAIALPAYQQYSQRAASSAPR